MSDQTKFWQAVMQALANSAGVETPYNMIMAPKSLACNFADSKLADEQLVNLAQTIPPWSLTWSGNYNSNFFNMYKSWLNMVVGEQPSLDPEAEKRAQDIQNKIMQIKDGLQELKKTHKLDYMQENCQELSENGAYCKVWNPGYCDQTFEQYWQEYKKTPIYKQQARMIEQSQGASLSGLSIQWREWSIRAYGPDFEALDEALTTATLADPHHDNYFEDDAERKQYQIPITTNGATIWTPRFTLQGDSYHSFAEWLKSAKEAANNGADPEVVVELSNSIDEQTGTSWKLSFDVAVPLEDFFMIGARGSTSTTTLDVSKYDFKGTLTYQSVKHISLGPELSWFDSSMLAKYSNLQTKNPKSPFFNKKLWGPGGIFNLRIGGVIVGYQPRLKMEVANWTDSEVHTKWTAEADYSIAGIIHIGSASTSGSYDHVKYTSTDNGFELTDTSEQPQIIALVVDTINYP